MKTFHCDNCGMVVFFENDHCGKCGEPLGFRPDSLEMTAKAKWAAQSVAGNRIQECANRENHNICNWLIVDGHQSGFCLACRLNEVIPDLHIQGNVERWRRLEAAKRRCLYTYLKLGLPIEVTDGRAPLRFKFLADEPNKPVLTGHENGLITLNIAEADGDERERRRLKMHEPYRTLAGHFRHETGHYYWDRLIANSNNLDGFRKLFGDETLDYGEAMKKYYREGPAANWPNRTITAYASWHPWEDWAETWAHYLHMVDTMETAASFGLGVAKLEDGQRKMTVPVTSDLRDFDKLMGDWQPLTLALNSINRGMGISDLYPFVISEAVTKKLRFVHQLIWW